MRIKPRLVVLAGLVCMASLPVLADDFDAGVAALKAKEFDKAESYLRPLAEQGNVDAMEKMGLVYIRREDYPKAIEWYEKAADAGQHKSMNNLGVMYFSGWEGVEPDYDKAYQYFTMAANLGNVRAQEALGVLYYRGEGVEKDLQTSFFWFHLSWTHGYAAARERRDGVAKELTEEQIRQAEAQAEQWKPVR